MLRYEALLVNKGCLNQRAALDRRAALVERL
jgi:hypothetical protein